MASTWIFLRGRLVVGRHNLDHQATLTFDLVRLYCASAWGFSYLEVFVVCSTDERDGMHKWEGREKYGEGYEPRFNRGADRACQRQRIWRHRDLGKQTYLPSIMNPQMNLTCPLCMQVSRKELDPV